MVSVLNISLEIVILMRGRGCRRGGGIEDDRYFALIYICETLGPDGDVGGVSYVLVTVNISVC